MKSRKLLALFLAIFMLASLVVPASAEITPDAETTTAANAVVGYNAALVVKEDLSQIPEMKTFDATSDQKTYKIVDIDDWDAFDAAITSTATANNKRGLVGYTIYLANDLDFADTETDTKAIRTPLGSSSAGFAGKFDGQGYAIKNLEIHSDGESSLGGNPYFGLFAMITAELNHPATVENLIIDSSVEFDPYNNGTITSGPAVMSGALAGCVDTLYGNTAKTEDSVGSVEIKNVLNQANVAYRGALAGGLIAFAKACKLSVSNCTNAGDIIAFDPLPLVEGALQTKDYTSVSNACGIGGIVGAFGERCPNKNGDKPYYLSGSVTDCRNSGNIVVKVVHPSCATYSSNTYDYSAAGGIVGSTRTCRSISGRALTIDNCINNGDVSYTGTHDSTSYTGLRHFAGILGYTLWTTANGHTTSVTNCKNYGTISKGSLGEKAVTAEIMTVTADGVTNTNNTEAAGQLDFTYNMTAQYYQLSKEAKDGKYSLRLVALHNNIDAYVSFGYDITIAYNGKTVKASLNDLTTVNTSIAADNGMGATLVSATELGGEYVSAVRIDNISTAYGTLTVTLTPKMTAKGATEPTLGTPITFTVTPNYN